LTAEFLHPGQKNHSFGKPEGAILLTGKLRVKNHRQAGKLAKLQEDIGSSGIK
jgi:hypothetical protein